MPLSDRGAFRICVVCSGNICRSPMGEIVLRQLLTDAGPGEQVVVTSVGTGDWHVGEPADRRTVLALTERGYDGSRHRAAWLDPDVPPKQDLMLVADRAHLRDVTELAEQSGAKVDIRLLRSFDPEAVAAGTLEVDDPYYGGPEDFARCLAEVETACVGVVAHVRAELADS